MKNIFFRVILFIKFCLTAKSSKGFGIHSPFVYNFTRQVLNNPNKVCGIREIENLRKSLLKSNEIIEIEDFGAGSQKLKSNFRKISEIAKTSSTNQKNGILLNNIVNYFNIKNILELGTSLGIGTAYLSFNNSNTKIITIEGSKTIFEKAKENFAYLNLVNIEQINSKFDDVLQDISDKNLKFDFIFIDGNHRKEATLKYFDIILTFCHKNTILLFDDISWNKDMQIAWKSIIKNEKVKISIDLFFQGIVFVNNDFQKQDYKIRY